MEPQLLPKFLYKEHFYNFCSYTVLQKDPDPNGRLSPGQRLDGLGLLLRGPGALRQGPANLRRPDPGLNGHDGRRLRPDHGLHLRQGPGSCHQERVQR